MTTPPPTPPPDQQSTHISTRVPDTVSNGATAPSTSPEPNQGKRLSFREWTGIVGHVGPLKNNAGDRDYYPAKTLWDWMQLLIVPLVLAFFVFWLTAQQQDRAHQASTEQHRADAIATLDQARESLLNTYIDRMSAL